MYGIVYLVTCLANGKVYVGQTVRTLQQRWKAHCKLSNQSRYLSSAIQKYGSGQFQVETLVCAFNKEGLDELEIFFIAKYRSADKRFGYNLTLGGGGVVCNDQTREKFRLANTGSRNPQYGKKRSREQIEASAALRRGKKLPFKARGSQPREWRPDSIRRIAEGNRIAKTGKPRSEDLKRKLREANSGENNPQFGTKWVIHHPTGQVDKVPSDQVALLLRDGWELGRK